MYVTVFAIHAFISENQNEHSYLEYSWTSSGSEEYYIKTILLLEKLKF